MENFSYHVPFYVVTNGVATQGFTSDLAGGQIGVFDRQNFAVATAAGVGKELFFAQGNIGGKDWYGNPVTESHKSPFFKVKDVTNIYKSLPAKIQNEEWVLGYDGSQSSKSLEFVKGEPTNIKLYFHGEPVYRMFNGPKEYAIGYTPDTDCTTDCATDCGGTRKDPKPHAMKVIDMINNHVELQKLGVRAKLVENTFAAATETREKYSISVMDDGTGVALAKIQGKYPTVKISRTSRTGIVSTYEFNQPIPDAAPAAFSYDGSQIAEAVCGTCPSGWSTVSGYDTYMVKRVVTPTTDLSTSAARGTFAGTVSSAYTGIANTAQYLGVDGGIATVKINVATGATVAAQNSDTVELIGQVATACQAPAGATVAWVLGTNCISSKRTLKIKLNRAACDAAGDRTADITKALTGIKGVDIASLAVIHGDACADEYTVNQASDDCLTEDCLTSNVTFTYDTPLPLIDGKAWEIQEPVITADDTRKVGIRISAGYFDPKFGNCSFDPYDYYEVMPVKMEVSLYVPSPSKCSYIGLATQNKVKIARIARQSGEYVVREQLMKTEAYLKHVKQWDNDVRMREAFDMQLLNTVERKAFYVLYYVTFGASYNASSRNGEKEKFTAVFAVKEDDSNIDAFEKNLINVVAGKAGVTPHTNK